MSDTTLILRAAEFAALKHRNQRRKDADASPYINHPLALARLLAEDAGVTDTVTLCAALLHDTIEDTATTHAELVLAFGAQVAAVVSEVTDDKTLPKAERKYLQIEHAAHISEEPIADVPHRLSVCPAGLCRPARENGPAPRQWRRVFGTRRGCY